MKTLEQRITDLEHRLNCNEEMKQGSSIKDATFNFAQPAREGEQLGGISMLSAEDYIRNCVEELANFVHDHLDDLLDEILEKQEDIIREWKRSG